MAIFTAQSFLLGRGERLPPVPHHLEHVTWELLGDVESGGKLQDLKPNFGVVKRDHLNRDTHFSTLCEGTPNIEASHFDPRFFGGQIFHGQFPPVWSSKGGAGRGRAAGGCGGARLEEGGATAEEADLRGAEGAALRKARRTRDLGGGGGGWGVRTHP